MMNRLLSLILLFIIFGSQNLFAMEQPIVILYSDNNQSYMEPAQIFKEKQTQKVLEFSLHGNVDQAPEIMSELMGHKPALIFALGARAAWFAKVATKQNLDTKVLFAMVINWQRYNLLDGQPNMLGISSDIAPGTQLFNLSLISPKAKRIGVIYSEKFSQTIIEEAEKAAQLLGLELVATSIENAGSLKRAWRLMASDIDSYWVLTDPELYTMGNIHWLSERCLKEKIVCIGQSTNITKLGVLLSINPDDENIGLQAVGLAKRFLLNENLNGSGKVVDPIGTKVTFNRSTADKIGLTVNAQTLSMVNQVVKE